MNKPLLAMLCLSALLWPSSEALAGKKGRAETREEVGDVAGGALRAEFGQPVAVAAPGVAEPSGITWHAGLGRLLVIGDEGSLTVLTREGKKDWTVFGLGDLEDVAVHEPTGLILLLSEKQARIYVFDPKTRKTIGTWKLDRAGLLGREPSDPNSGFEGLAVKPAGGNANEVLLYLSHQAKPAMVVVAKVPMTTGNQTVSAPHVQDSFTWKGYSDLTAITCVPHTRLLAVVSEKTDSLLLVDEAGHLKAVYALAGVQQEGICFDPMGTMWIADDQGGLLRYDGAVETLTPKR